MESYRLDYLVAFFHAAVCFLELSNHGSFDGGQRLEMRVEKCFCLVFLFIMSSSSVCVCTCVLDFIYLFSERGERREKEGERNISVREKHRSVASHRPPTRDPALNPGVYPDQELNWQWSTGQRSIHLATPARVSALFLISQTRSSRDIT